MPRTKRECLPLPNVIFHVWNRGVDRMEIFDTDWECELFMNLLFAAQERFAVSIIAVTLMRNHFHQILHQHEPEAVSAFMKKVSEDFARSFNRRRGRSGHLFTGRYKGDVVEDGGGLLRLSGYVHRNPQAAGLVRDFGDWKYSSCRAYMSKTETTCFSRSLILDLVGGVEGYLRFLKEYDPGDPGSIDDFLVADHEKIWARRGQDWARRRGKGGGRKDGK